MYVCVLSMWNCYNKATNRTSQIIKTGGTRFYEYSIVETKRVDQLQWVYKEKKEEKKKKKKKKTIDVL
jgi:hypothetical protein